MSDMVSRSVEVERRIGKWNEKPPLYAQRREPPERSSGEYISGGAHGVAYMYCIGC